MKVFRPSNLIHTLEIIPREYPVNVLLSLRDKDTDQTQVIPVVCANIGGYLTGTFEYIFKEARSYDMTVTKTTGERLYTAQAYATDETDLQNYTLLK